MSKKKTTKIKICKSITGSSIYYHNDVVMLIMITTLRVLPYE